MISLVRLKSECSLHWEGIHGISHWQRVRNIGLKLAPYTGAKKEIVEIFAFLHDLKRLNDGSDPYHGKRAAEFIRTIQGSDLFLQQEDADLLCYACEFHSYGLTEADVTIQTCWDADRLDLGRIGIRPNQKYLCTDVAKDPDIINWAFKMSKSHFQ